MRYVLSDVAAEHYRTADGMWSEDIDDAERFDFDAAKIRRDELLEQDCHTRIVETSGRKRSTNEAMVLRVTSALRAVEAQWKGQTIGIGYEADTASGRVTVTLQPEDRPHERIVIAADVANISVGAGETN